MEAGWVGLDADPLELEEVIVDELRDAWPLVEEVLWLPLVELDVPPALLELPEA